MSKQSVLIAILGLSPIGCQTQSGGTQGSSAAWRSDLGFVLKRLVFLKACEKCHWRSGVAQNRSGGLVAGPSSYDEVGYAVLSEGEAKRIEQVATWTDADLGALTIETPPGGGSDSDLALEGRILESAELTKLVMSQNGALSGRFVFAPDKRLIYFRFLKD